MTILGKTIVAILLIGGIGGGVFYATNFMKNDVPVSGETEMVAQSGTTTNEEMVTGEEVEGKVFTDKDMSFQELMKKTGSYECTVKQSVMGVTTEGKVFIKGSNVSAKFSSRVQGQVFDTSMITKEGYVYTWSSVTPTTGVKTKIAATGAQASTTAALSASYAFDGKDIGSYSCVVANITESTFTIPASVTFTEIAQ
jgi:hypothetical protein